VGTKKLTKPLELGGTGRETVLRKVIPNPMERNDDHLGTEIPGKYSRQSGDAPDCPLDLLCDWSFQLLRQFAHF
jgi:hypothetical protein